jgi:hypothetical protein
MLIRVVEFSSGGTKLERLLPKENYWILRIGTFWHLPINPILKNFFSVCCPILYPPLEKIDNRYCHSIDRWKSISISIFKQT